MIRQTLAQDVFVKNEDGLVYRMYATEMHEMTMYLHLELVAIPNDITGWVEPREEETEHLVCYILNESIKECLWANDFEIIKENPLKAAASIEDKMIEYGFSEEQAAQLLKGKVITTFYGKVKYYKSKQELLTVYHATGKKEYYRF